MNSRALAADVLARLPDDPAVYPLKLDLVRDAALVVKFDEAAFDRESFLDDRMLDAHTRGAWVPLETLAEAARRIAEPVAPEWIFHVGHCGSTLLSRVLSEGDQVLSLREPLPLRTLAEEAGKRGEPHWRLGEERFQSLMRDLLALWGRAFRPGQRVLIKATSHCNDLAQTLLAPATSTGVALTIPPRDYVAAMLRQSGGSADLMAFAESRLMRLHRHLGCTDWQLAEMEPGVIAAMSWLTEVVALHRCEQAGGRLLWVDFDTLLSRPEETLSRIADHFGWPRSGHPIEAMVASEAFHYYAKAPEYPYQASSRRQQLDESAARNETAITAAMRWLEKAVQAHPELDALVPLNVGERS